MTETSFWSVPFIIPQDQGEGKLYNYSYQPYKGYCLLWINWEHALMPLSYRMENPW